MLARAGTDTLGEERQADAHQLAVRSLGRPARRAGRRSRRCPSPVAAPRVVAGVVLPAGGCGVRELLGSQQVLHPQLGGIHAELVGEAVDDALDEVHRLGDAERAGVGDTTGRLVRVHARDLAVRGAVVVRAGEDVEEAGRVLRRLGGGVERTVVGDHVDAEPDDLAVARRGDRALHVVVAGEAGRHQVLGAVLHPLDRLAGDDRPDDRAHVAGIDRHLVAEAAADVGRDHLDLVLGQAGDERVHGAVGVRRLRVRPERELAGHRVHVGDGAARLHRRRVRPRVQHVLRHDDVGARRTRRRWRPCRRTPSRRCGCSSGPLCRRGSPARRRRAPAWRPSPGRAVRTRRRSTRPRHVPSSGPRRRRTRPLDRGSAPCRWRAPPACRTTASASTPARACRGRHP